MNRFSSLALLVLILLGASLLQPAAFAAQSVQLTGGPVTGAAPLEVDFVAEVSGPNDATRMYCTLSFGDSSATGPERLKFVLEGPWPQRALFSHTYRYAGAFLPELVCEGSGTIGDWVAVTVSEQAGNHAPVFTMSITPATGGVDVPRTIAVSGVADADGDVLDCFADFNVIDDRNFNNTAAVVSFTMAPPYGQRTFVRSYDVSATYRPRVFCIDGRGGWRSVGTQLTVPVAPGNTAPAVLLDRMFATETTPGESRRFRVRASDANSQTLRCHFRPDSSGERRRFTVAPPYTAVDQFHVFKHGGEYQAYLSCVDTAGVMVSANRGFTVLETSPSFAAPQVFDFDVSPSEGSVPPAQEVNYLVNVWDPEGSPVTCRLEFGAGEGGVDLDFPQAVQGTPVFVPHAYARRGSQGATLSCEDAQLRASTEYAWVHLEEPGKRFPVVALDANPRAGGGLLPVTFTLEASDPDGEVLNCNFRFGNPYPGGGELPEDVDFQMAPPYAPVELTHTYRGTHEAQLSCVDPGGRRHQDGQWITIASFNQPPIIESFEPTKTSTINNSLLAFFPIRLTDPNLDRTVACDLDFGDGIVWPNLLFEYPDYTPRTITHLYGASAVPYSALLSCDDGEGAYVERGERIEVGPAANRAPEVRFNSLPASGSAPLKVSFRFSASDVNQVEGDTLACVLHIGDRGRQIAIDPTATLAAEYVYENAGAYRPVFECVDRFGATARHSLSVGVSIPGGNTRGTTVQLGRNP